MKKTVFMLLAALIFAGIAEAAMQTHGDLTIDVPEGWLVEKNENVIVFWAPDKSMALVTVQSSAEGTTVKAYAEQIAQGCNGSLPTVAENNWYTFTYTDQGAGDCYAAVAGDEKSGSYLAMTMAAKNLTHPQFKAMYDTVKFTAEEQPLSLAGEHAEGRSLFLPVLMALRLVFIICGNIIP